MGEGGFEMTVQQEIVEKKDRRVGKGKVIAISRIIYRIQNTDVFYVESESNDGMYYYVMYDTTKEFEWCSCKDFERNGYMKKCKHLFAIEFAIKMNTVKDTDKLPPSVKKDNNSISSKDSLSASLSWKDDQYGF
jgi:predicted nucleic acid-binding Zn finger protein